MPENMNKGFILLPALYIFIVLLILSSAMVETAFHGMVMVEKQKALSRSYYFGLGGIRCAMEKIRSDPAWCTDTSDPGQNKDDLLKYCSGEINYLYNGGFKIVRGLRSMTAYCVGFAGSNIGSANAYIYFKVIFSSSEVNELSMF